MAYLSNVLDAILRRGLDIVITKRFSWTGFGGQKMSNYKYFSDDEVAGLDKELCAKLDVARDKAGVPFIITSGKRTPEGNAGLSGAVSDSAHLSGLAVDLSTPDDHTLNRVMYGLCVAGLGSRIGIYYAIDTTNPDKLIPRHIHVDLDTKKQQEVTWALKEKN